MNERPKGDDENRARLTRTLEALKDLRSQVDELTRARSEPIAVVGLGCRYPGGVQDAESFWRLLREEQDAICEVPLERWDVKEYYDPQPDAPGKISTRFGGFLDGIDQFDPYFFGIAPREASSMDPQQRLLLEIAWEAFEHAGLAADRLRGSRTGVFVGISGSEYAHRLLNAPPETIDSYLGSGNASSVAAGRLSYVFGFEGPSLAIDTACSSSLVSIHLACQSLRLGECDLALAGGVNVILTPTISINHSRARMLAADGRCKTFDASADGFVRSEGCGLVVLKRLSDALAHGDLILAEIRGSALNQDGHTSGLTVPSGPAQQRVIRDALALGRLSPSDVSYVEAHGTGTALGDPIELNALAAVFGGRPVERPLFVGSVKTNIGHAEAAAGVAGLIKVLLALQHETIPPNLHLRQPTPRVPWSEMPLVVAASATAWPRSTTPRIAGVSSFGFGGTNAHVVLAESKERQPREQQSARPMHLLALSAQSDKALENLADRYKTHLALHPDQAICDICHTAASGRSHLQHRLAVVSKSRADLMGKLGESVGTREGSGVVLGKPDPARPPSIAFLCTGQGAQYAGMAHELFKTQPVFRRHLERCDELLRGEMERPLLDLLYAEPVDDRLHQTLYTQPALFALEYALGSLWMSWGVVPDLLMGHSLGEYVAACLAGVFSIEDGIRLIAARARLMQNLPGAGAMAALFVSEKAARSAIAALAPDVSVAAVNGPQHVVISGRRSSLERVTAHFAASGVDGNALNVSQAFHSVLVEPMLAEFERVLESVTFSPPRLDLVSNLTGKLAGPEVTTPAYWRRHAREAVQFSAGLRTCAEQGVGIFLEVGPHPVLLGMGRRCLSDSGHAWLPSLRRGQDDWQVMLETLGALYVRGAPVDWQAFDAPYEYRRVRAPTYPFQRQRYWAASHEGTRASPTVSRQRESQGQSLLGVRLHVAHEPHQILFESELATPRQRLLDDHRVFGAAIMPASGMIDMALSAGSAALAAQRMSLENVLFHRPLMIPDEGSRIVQTSLNRHPSSGYAFQIQSRAADTVAEQPPAWTLHASGMLRIESGPHGFAREDMPALRQRIVEPMPTDDFYKAYAARGIVFGPSLRAVDDIRHGNGEALARIHLPEAEHASDYWLNPVWLDACAQVLGAAWPVTDATYLQASIHHVRINRFPEGSLWCHAKTRSGGLAENADLRLLNDAGEVFVELTGVEARRADAAMLQKQASSAPKPELYELRWLAQPRAKPSGVCLPEPAQIAAALRPQLDQACSQPRLIEYADALAGLDTMTPGLVADAFRQLGWSYRMGDVFTSDDVREALNVAPKHQRLLERVLALLAKFGVLRRTESRWQVTAELPQRSPVNGATYDSAQAELEMLDRCGSRLADVLTGRCDPLQLLFPDGDRAAATKIYHDSPGAAAMHTMLRTAVARLRESWPADRPLRILEVGAGTGGATAYVLPELPPNAEYIYTDISRGFFTEARRKFAQYDFIRYETLDIERAPDGQGFAGREFDVLIAFNVLHATQSLRKTIAHVRDLLADDGLLLVLEDTEPADWVDLIWGLTPGWWRFNDHDLRPSHPLLTAKQWRQLLTASGFKDVEAIHADPQKLKSLSRQALLIGRTGPRAADRAEHPQTWLILADSQGLGEQLAEAIKSRGDRGVCVRRGTGFTQSTEARFTINPDAPGDLRQLLALLHRPDTPLRGIIHLWGLDAPGTDGLTAATITSESLALAGNALHLTQALLSQKLEPTPRVWLVTRGCQPIGEGSDPPQVAQAALWGMGMAVAREHPEVWGGMIDLDPATTADSAGPILEEIFAPDGEDRIGFRGGHRFVARMAACDALVEKAAPGYAEGTYLITGGCGALGLETARWLVAQGARHLALLGRSGAATTAARAAIADLERRGAAITLFQTDVADETGVRQVLSQIRATGFPLRGVVHAAGLPGQCTIAELNSAGLENMFAAKIAGTWILHDQTRDMGLDFFVCFSSMVSLWGAKQQSHYIAANHFIDVFMHYRRALGLPALGINWGPLRGGGMLPPEDIGELERIGVSTTPLNEATHTLAVLLRSDIAQAAAVSIDWPLFQGIYQSRGPCRMFDLVAARRGSGPIPAAAPQSAILERLRGAPENERREILLSHVQSTVAQVLELDIGRIPDSRQGFFDMGMDSLTAMELRTKLQASLCVSLPATLVFDYGTPDALADFLLRDKLDGDAPAFVTGAREEDNRGLVTHEMLEQMSDEEAEALLEAKLLTL